MATAVEELAFAGPGRLAELVRAREVTPRELVELSLERIAAHNPRLNAFRTVLADQALAEAEAHDHQGALAGVPIAIKDDMPLAGQVTTWGSRTYGPPAGQDAEVVRRLRAAGAIPIGITNVPELMIWPWTASAANGITRNPWDMSRTPGGSSGGSAAAVAAGLVPGATGSDGGGSIRIPAACCGLVGMKPSRGRVSLQPAGEAWLGLSTFGGLARTVADSALLLDVIHGTVPGDLDRLPAFTGSYRDAAASPPGKLRVAVSRKPPPGMVFLPVSADQHAAWERTSALLAELGHEVVERHPAYGTVSLLFSQLWLRGIHMDALTVPDPAKLEPVTQQMSRLGRRLVPDRRAERLRMARGAAAARILALWEDVDVLLTPGLATSPPAAQGGYGRSLAYAFNLAGTVTPWTPPFNVTGQPAVTIPAGLGADGVPVSVQLVGRIGAEDTLYSLAAQIEEAAPWASLRPSMS